MAGRPIMSPLFVSVVVLLAAFACASFEEGELLADPSFLNFGSGLACEFAKCLKGHCANSSSFPFYKCECNAGWQSPFGASWLPCILPNCSIDLTCANRSVAAPAPSAVPIPSFSGGLDVCSLHVCGNGECIQNKTSAKNATDDYECVCDPGYVNLGNKADGYCIRKCSIGADCTNVKLPFGGAGNTSSPPPPAVVSPASSSSSPSVNQGTSPSPSTPIPTASTSEGQISTIACRLLVATTTLILVILWR